MPTVKFAVDFVICGGYVNGWCFILEHSYERIGRYVLSDYLITWIITPSVAHNTRKEIKTTRTVTEGDLLPSTLMGLEEHECVNFMLVWKL